jgi:hypothetical protein
MGWFSKNDKRKGKLTQGRMMEKDLIDQCPSYDGKTLTVQIKGIGLLCTFLVDPDYKSLYFTLDGVTYLKRHKEISGFQANRLLIPLCRFSGIPFDDCIVSFCRQGQVMSRILLRQMHQTYFIENAEIYPFGKDNYGCGWVIKLTDHNDWWTGKGLSKKSHELAS